MKRNILVVSPHLDDAAISCADHIRRWRSQGHTVRVTTLFTDFGEAQPSDYMKRFLIDQGFKNNQDYSSARKTEDHAAMQRLDVEYLHGGLRDAGFRELNGTLLYPDYKALTRSKIEGNALAILDKIKFVLSVSPSPDLVVAPLGIGNHIDHLIAREASRSSSSHSALGFYFDFPYARNPLKYRVTLFRLLKGLQLSVMKLSSWKREVLACYKTQMPYLFRTRPFYPEVLFLPPSPQL